MGFHRPIPQEIVITQSSKTEGTVPSSPVIAVSNAVIPNTVATAAGFANLGLSAELLRAVAEQGYTDPTPIQAQAIPVVMAGRDLLGAAQTGTGKTAGFTLPLLFRLGEKASNAPRRPVRALILVPTRELCAQVQDSVKNYGRHMKMTSTTIYGGVGFHPQVQALRRGVDIVVATPGRLLDHVQQRTIDLRNIEILVLDEADRMLDMGFIHDIRRIVALLPKERQTLMFSATFSDEIRQLSAAFLRDPALVEVARRNAPIELVTQVVHPVDKDKKRALLAHLVKTHSWQQVLVFCKTKHGANRLAEQLTDDGIDSDAIHGNKSQPQRMKALKRFKDCQVQVLVATDIAARGIDIDALPHVVNYDLPNVAEDYVHRIGRTGRAGASGDAVSLVCGEDRSLLSAIERLIGKRIDQQVVPGFEPTQSFRASAEKKRGAPSRGGQPSRNNSSRDSQPRSGQPARGGRPGGQPQAARRSGQGAGNGGGYAGRGSDRNGGGGNGGSRSGEWSNSRSAPGAARRGAPASGGNAAPLTSWEAEREAQRKHFGQEAQKTDDRSGGKRVMDAVTSLLRKVA
jgi:ATP-dependent RNA helicase RhlE